MQDDAHDIAPGKDEAMRLLYPDEGWTEMAAVNSVIESQPGAEARYTDEANHAEPSRPSAVVEDETQPNEELMVYKVYKIRWFGLMQLVLLNIVVSWDVWHTHTMNTDFKQETSWLIVNLSGSPSPP